MLLHYSGVPVREANHQDQKRFSCGVLNNKFIMIKVGDRNMVSHAPVQDIKWSPSNEPRFELSSDVDTEASRSRI